MKDDKLQDDAALRVLAPGAVGSLEEVPRQRKQFRILLTGNPNYFGNIAKSSFPPVIAIKGNTTYEEIKCVGFHPQEKRLDAVVFVKQPFGYAGGICSAGSPEYVRFYLSFDHGATWVDQGVTSFTSYDVPVSATGGKRLEYAVSIPCSPPRKWCTVPNVILARAILSWNQVPPPNTPDYPPVWGNVHDTHIQVDPRLFLKWLDVLKLGEIKLAPLLAQSLDLNQEVAAAPPKTPSVAELKDLYHGKGVEPHRYALAAIKKVIQTPDLPANVPHLIHPALAEQAGFKLADVIEKMLATDGSTVYEELDCVGLRPNGMSNELVGVLRIKRPNGFSGGPCTAGSREYVTFWADFNNNGTFETCLGTASVQVFDLDVPAAGLEYSVNLPVDLNPYRRPCGEGPRVVPIRAILSWNDVPECSNPNWRPVWGNREETLILIPPGNPVMPGDYSPFLFGISGIAVCDIAQSTGLATGDRPFGGRLCIMGEIPGAVSLAVPDTLEYRVWATQGATTIPLVTPFSLEVHQGSGPGIAVSTTINQSAPDGFFTYREYGTPALGAWRRLSNPIGLLAYWDTGSLTGTWTIHVEARVAGTLAPIYAAATTVCTAGPTFSSVKVTLDQEPPVAEVKITGYTDASGPHAAVACGDFTKGVTIEGTFDITDNKGVGSYTLKIEPPGTIIIPTVDPGSTPTHLFGTWVVETESFEPCGYVVHLEAHDRTVVNCGSSWRHDDTVGFCLRKGANG